MTGVSLLVLTQLTMPVVLLWVGHSYRNRSPASKRFFWGGIIGYITAIMVVTTLLLIPPVSWGAEGGMRWLAIQWAPLVLPLAGATAARLALGTSAARG